ncbi:unnamed protein product [Strongylus vulgaris]|uniref:Uncharacterized protein n=1 Tax=Strongylus vulgaris TaxID=40348 RepID=A0A3P7LLW6_STRVU|nr:unnamed protein product [Strongylus vulgaris]
MDFILGIMAATGSEKQKRLNVILARQPQAIQNLYKTKVEREQAERERETIYKQTLAEGRGLGNYQKQMTAIENDMSISSAEADQREYQLKRQYHTRYPAAGRLHDDDDDDDFDDDD